MLLTDRSDAELVTLSRRGWAPAFAVLLHRHGPAVRAATTDAPDPTSAVRDTFLTAMRRLDEPAAQTDARGWLLELAGSHTRDVREVPTTAMLDPCSDDELEEIWADLDRRWPDGRRPRRGVPRPVRVAAFVLLLVALAAVVPVIAFTALDDREETVEEVRAVPDEDATADDAEPGTDGEPGDLDPSGTLDPDGTADASPTVERDVEVGDTLDLDDVTDDVDEADENAGTDGNAEADTSAGTDDSAGTGEGGGLDTP